jgi:hypothetical protein
MPLHEDAQSFAMMLRDTSHSLLQMLWRSHGSRVWWYRKRVNASRMTQCALSGHIVRDEDVL